ncbi:hypothetical protein CRG98_031885 [Punica granatum]|uniref:Uncharacterized protein n=1 Tax=Punica granatum TaxID=22663 RepID=A0A2I0IUT3_PUNGR|nr:hypothetical protein CRG98_031885 [Punica granatum]
MGLGNARSNAKPLLFKFGLGEWKGVQELRSFGVVSKEMETQTVLARQPRVVVIAYPAQGHVGPLMKLSCQIANCGIRGTKPGGGVLLILCRGSCYRNYEDLIRRKNSCEAEKVTCVVADGTFGWGLEVAEKLGIKRAMFWPTVVRGFVLALCLHLNHGGRSH